MPDKNLLHYVTATGIVVNSQNEFLIVKRANWEKAFPGKWTVPGGKLEVLDYSLKRKDTSEHWYNVIEDLLRKEINEEVGLEIKNIGYVTSMIYIRSDGIPCLIISLYAEPSNLKEDRINLCNALTDFSWVTIEEAKNYDLIEGIYQELLILDEKLKTGRQNEWKGL